MTKQSAIEELKCYRAKSGTEYPEEIEMAIAALEKLAKYEDLEEQGKLLKLPCVVGDTVYRINRGAKEPIIPMKVCEVGILSLKENGYVIQIMCRDEVDGGETHYLSVDFGKIVFFTKTAAKQALKDLEDKNRNTAVNGI